MVDNRAALPQELAGGHVGLPCARWRPRTHADKLQELGICSMKEQKTGLHLPGGHPDLRPDYQAFSGTRPMPLAVARARSTGALQKGGVLDKVLKLRTMTELDQLVQVLVDTAPVEPREHYRAFRQPFNPHRERMTNHLIPEEKRRRQVLNALKKYPLQNVYDLATCSPEIWSSISRELGGVSYGTAMRNVMVHVQEDFTPLERASFWAAVGHRQRIVDHGRVISFAADVP